MRKIKIINRLAFFSALLGFMGTLVIVMDRFYIIHNIIDNLPKWKNVAYAIEKLDKLDAELKDGQKVSILTENDKGFKLIRKIIYLNRAGLKNKKIAAIIKNQPIKIGGQPTSIIHVRFENNTQGYSLTNEFIFHEWINNFRNKYFLKKGIFLIGLGFLLGILGHIKINKNSLSLK